MGCVFNYPAKLIKGLSSFGPKGEETDNSKLIREMGEDLVNAISYVGDSRMDQFVNQYDSSTRDIDALIRYMSNYSNDGKTKEGYSSYDDLIANSDDKVKFAYIQSMKEMIYELVNNNINPNVYNGMESILKSATSLNVLHHAVKGVKNDKELMNRTWITRAINKKINLYENAINTFRHWEPGKKSLALTAELAEYSNDEAHAIMNKVKSLMDKAESMSVFKSNNITRGQISRMMTSMSDIDTTTENGIIHLTSLLVDNHNLAPDIAPSVAQALASVRLSFNEVNYGKMNINEGDLGIIAKNPKGGTIVGYYANMRARVKDYYDYAVANGAGDTKGMREVKLLLDNTELKMRKNYMPTTDQEQFQINIDEMEVEMPRIVTPGMYRPKEHFKNDDNNIDFESLVVANVIANRNVFNKAMMMVAREHLDYERTKSIATSNLNDNNYMKDVLYTAGLQVKKYDRLINYVPSRQTMGAKTIKSVLGGLDSVFVAGIIGGPASAIKNTVAGRHQTLLAGIVAGTPGDIETLKKSGTDMDKLIISEMEEVVKNFTTPGIASNYQSVPDNVIDGAGNFLRKTADWLGDGGLLSSIEFVRKNLTVKGTEQAQLRSYLKPMVFAEVNRKMSLMNIDPESDRAKAIVKELVQKTTIDAWTDLSAALGHFDPINKPLWAHISYDTAETAPAALAGLVAKRWYLFRHIMVTAADNIARQFSGAGSGYQRWNYRGASDLPEGFHTGGIINNPKAHLGGAVALAVFSLVRELLRKDEDEIDSKFDQVVDFTARTHVPLIDSMNSIQGLDDTVKFLAFTSGVMNVDTDTYERYKKGAIGFAMGMAGGREISEMLEEEGSGVQGLINLLTLKADWMNVFTDDIVDAGLYGRNLKEIRMSYRDDTQLLRQIWAVDAISTGLFEVGMLGGLLKESSDPKAARLQAKTAMTSFILRATGLAMWNDDTFDTYSFKKKYVHNSSYNKSLNDVRDRQYNSAIRYNRHPTSRAAYIVYNKNAPRIRTRGSYISEMVNPR